jgi:cobalt-precorrin 5A hydrolase / precorrin-3B C17-methyltransferase
VMCADARAARPVYPVFLTNLDTCQTVVVGGGEVATRKVRGLLAAQANVRVISPALSEELHKLHDAGAIAWSARAYVAGDLAGAGLAFAATNVRGVNHAVAEEARQRGVLCNVADAPAEGAFHVPAVYRDGETVIAVGTGGAQPRRAAQLRDWIGQLLAKRA